MVRTLLCLAIVVVQLATQREACCRPPDEVAHSPIPPLKQLQPRRSARSVHTWSVSPKGKIHESALLQNPLTASTKRLGASKLPPASSLQNRAATRRLLEDNNAERYGTEQLEIWNRPEMLEARNAVVEFCQRSAQTSPAEGQQFLARLSQLPPKEMRLWLDRYQKRRMSFLNGREVEELARQFTTDRAISRLEAIRQASANVADLRSQAAAAKREQDQTAPQSGALKRGRLSIGITQFFYDPFDAVTDPMSPRGYSRRVAAAMSLPGDLPRSDPRNFIRGDVGVELDERATGRDTQPPITPTAVAPALPTVNTPDGQK